MSQGFQEPFLPTSGTSLSRTCVSSSFFFFVRSFRNCYHQQTIPHVQTKKGRDMVEYLEHGLLFHIAHELKHRGNESHDKNNEKGQGQARHEDDDDDATILERLERAFLMADIHSNQLGITTSGATVAVCLVQVSDSARKICTHVRRKRTGDDMLHSHFLIVSSPTAFVVETSARGYDSTVLCECRRCPNRLGP